jgi:hypothetical protein
LDGQLDLLNHTQLHTITVYTIYNSLQFNITLAESSQCLHLLPVFQYRRIRSPATLQLFSEDCWSARILTRISTEICTRNYSLLSCQLTNSASKQASADSAISYIAGERTRRKHLFDSPTVGWRHYRNGPQRKRIHCCVVVYCCVYIRCHNNGCQHVLYCLEHTSQNINTFIYFVYIKYTYFFIFRFIYFY